MTSVSLSIACWYKGAATAFLSWMFGKRAAELLREVVDVLPEHLPAYNVRASLAGSAAFACTLCLTLAYADVF